MGAQRGQHLRQPRQQLFQRVEALGLPRHHMLHPADEPPHRHLCLGGKLHHEREPGGQQGA